MADVDIPSSYTINVSQLKLAGEAGADVELGSDPTRPVGLNLLGLNDVNVDVSGGLDVGLDDVNIRVDPLSVHLDPVQVDLGLDDVNLDVGLTGDPNRPVTVDLGLDDVNLDVGLTGDPNQPITVDLGLDNVNVDLGLDDINVCFNFAFTDLPNVRVNVPTQYDFGFTLFGCRIFNFAFAGETALISQDNPPQLFYKPLSPEPPTQPMPSLQSSDYSYKVTLGE
jgi:hypothetical protein